MIDFKKLHNDWFLSLPKERQEEILLIRKLEKEHMYYETTTLADNECGATPKEEERNVQLYRPVFNDTSVGETILLSFGGYAEYGFDQRYYDRFMTNVTTDSNYRLCIDVGGKVYIKGAEMLRILTEAKAALDKRNISLIEDYHPSLTQSNLGEMLQEMGLI